MSQTSAGKIQARDRERGNPQQATSTVPYEEAQYGEPGSGPLPGRSADRSFADYASAAQQGESGTGTRPAEAGTFGRQHTVPGVGSPVPESAPTLEPLPPPGGSAPAAAGGFGMQPRLSAPATPTVLSAPTPQPALPSPLTSPSHSAPAPAPASPSSSAAPAASPQVRQATADSGAPQMRAQGVHPPPPRVGTAAQRPPGETHGAARADLYGPPRTVSYDRPAADGYGQVAIPSAPDDEITVL
ncbi:MAG: hypothetical protein ACXVW7_02045, partial [Trebonia sp.]